MLRRICAYVAITSILWQPALLNERAEAQSSTQPGYVVDGNVDQALAVKLNRVADCNITRNAATVAQQTKALSEEATKFEIRLAQAAAFKNTPTKAITSVEDSVLVDLVARNRLQASPSQLKGIAETADKALAEISNADRLLSYALMDGVPTTMEKHREDVELARDSLISTLSELRGNWLLREDYRGDMARRGVVLDTAFYETCTGDGFWKLVTATQSAGGQTFDMSDNMSKDCEGNGAVDPAAYIGQYKKEIAGDDDAGSECKDLRVVTDLPEKVELKEMCLSNGDWYPVTEVAEKISNDQVRIQTFSEFTGGNTNTMSFTYQKCGN